MLKDVSLVARPGQVTAIVGSTGAGKTTLLELIPRLIDPTAGSVLDYIIGVDDTGSYTFAKAVTEDAELDDLLADIHEDFERVERLANECQWTDKSPIPPDVFDPSFKPSDKKWWKVWGRSQ